MVLPAKLLTSCGLAALEMKKYFLFNSQPIILVDQQLQKQ
jgi:hypothetical protein